MFEKILVILFCVFYLCWNLKIVNLCLEKVYLLIKNNYNCILKIMVGIEFGVCILYFSIVFNFEIFYGYMKIW